MKFLVIGGIDLSQNKETEIQLQYIEKCKELLAKSSTKRPTFHIQNEGCQMNSIQTESIAAIMEKMGYEMVDTEDADAVVFNTCTVRENANQKIYGHLGHLKSIKRNHPDMKIVLFGCMMQEHHVVEKIRKDYKYVNLVFGTHNIHKFPELFYRALQTDDQIIDIWKESDEIVEGMPTSRKYSFKTGVSVMFGCNNFCSYCIVPYVRGREKSREPQAIIREIEELVADGVTEIMLLGQNVNSYGKTLETPVTFSQLLKEVEKIEGLRRIRFMTSHPKDLSDELIQTMAESKKICHHLHLPLQSGSSRIGNCRNQDRCVGDLIGTGLSRRSSDSEDKVAAVVFQLGSDGGTVGLVTLGIVHIDLQVLALLVAGFLQAFHETIVGCIQSVVLHELADTDLIGLLFLSRSSNRHC